MISIRTLSLLVYFTYIFIDISIYALGNTSYGPLYGGQSPNGPSLGIPSLCGVVPRVPLLVTWRLSLSIWGVDMDGLAYPLHRPTVCSCQGDKAFCQTSSCLIAVVGSSTF
jgi:hypothetical protein